MPAAEPLPSYRRDADGSVARFYAKLPDGTIYDDHGSAITTTDRYAFLACEDGYLVFDAADLATVSAGGTVDVISSVDLEITPAFMNVENDTLYAGTFHLIPSYPAPDAHHLIAPSGNENAGVIFAYPADVNAPYGFATQAAYVYSIPDAVQGMAVLPDGNIMLSSSYGSPRRIYASTIRRRQQRGDAFLVDGREVPLYFLDTGNLVSDLVAPPHERGHRDTRRAHLDIRGIRGQQVPLRQALRCGFGLLHSSRLGCLARARFYWHIRELVEDRASLSQPLGFVEGGIGLCVEVRETDSSLCRIVHAHADGHAHGRVSLGQHVDLSQTVLDAIENGAQGVLVGRTGYRDGKLVATHAAGDIRGSDDLGKYPGNVAEHLVAHRMARTCRLCP